MYIGHEYDIAPFKLYELILVFMILTIFINFLSIVLRIFLCISAFQCNTTSDWLICRLRIAFNLDQFRILIKLLSFVKKLNTAGQDSVTSSSTKIFLRKNSKAWLTYMSNLVCFGPLFFSFNSLDSVM